jgi:hypothetical protein
VPDVLRSSAVYCYAFSCNRKVLLLWDPGPWTLDPGPVILTEERRPGMSENRVLRKMFGEKGCGDDRRVVTLV